MKKGGKFLLFSMIFALMGCTDSKRDSQIAALEKSNAELSKSVSELSGESVAQASAIAELNKERIATNAGSRLVALEKANLDLASQYATLAAAISTLNKQGAVAKGGADAAFNLALEAMTYRDTPAELDPASPTFQFAISNHWLLAVSVKNVEAYLDGSKVTFSIGNPWLADIASPTLKIKYGQARSAGGDYSQWDNGLNSIEEHMTVDLTRGKWTLYQVTLPHCTPDKLGFIRVSIDAPTIVLGGASN